MIEIIIAIIIFIIDIFTKFLVVNNMELGQSIPVITNIFNFTFVQNTGMAFGAMHGKNFLILTILLIIFPIFLYLSKDDIKSIYNQYKNHLIFRIAIGFFIGGALGNIFDRIFHGFVIDMFDFLIWPVFNVADSFISISIGIFVYFMIFKKEKKNEK